MLLEVSASTSPEASFLCEASTKASVQKATEHVALLWDLRARLAAAVSSADPESRDAVGAKRQRAPEAVAAASALIAPNAVSRKVVLTRENLEQALQTICGAEVAGAPAADGSTPGVPMDAGLFFAGRWLESERLLSDYVGSNEKSKVKVSFRSASGGAPMPQPCPSGASDVGPTSVASSQPACDVPLPATAEVGTTPPQSADATSAATGLAPPTSAAEAQKHPTSDATLSLSAFFSQQGSGHGGHVAGRAAAEEEDEVAQGDEDEDLPQLSSRQATTLVASRDVRAALQDARTAELLRHIDSAPTREGALRRLEKALNDGPFEQLTRTVLREIGYAPAASADATQHSL